MRVQYKGKENITDGVGLLISILLRYPEVSVVRYELEHNTLVFSFIFAKSLEKEQLAKIKAQLLEAIETWHYLERNQVEILEITSEETSQLESNQLTKIELQRDMESFALEEVSLLVNLINYLGLPLLTEEAEAFLEEDLILQEEVIRHLLDNVKNCDCEKDLFAFREEGRVLVFNH
ncbi:MAG: hypothetical protein MJ157_00885 [Clostridia bacterium]|nr:hypothetical protein [Clostridia bacterium]